MLLPRLHLWEIVECKCCHALCAELEYHPPHWWRTWLRFILIPWSERGAKPFYSKQPPKLPPQKSHGFGIGMKIKLPPEAGCRVEVDQKTIPNKTIAPKLTFCSVLSLLVVITPYTIAWYCLHFSKLQLQQWICWKAVHEMKLPMESKQGETKHNHQLLNAVRFFRAKSSIEIGKVFRTQKSSPQGLMNRLLVLG